MSALPTAIGSNLAQLLREQWPQLTIVEQRKGQVQSRLDTALSQLGDGEHYVGIACVVPDPVLQPTEHGRGIMRATYELELLTTPTFNLAEGGSLRDALTWACDIGNVLHELQLSHLPGQPMLLLTARAGSPLVTASDDESGYLIAVETLVDVFDKGRCGGVRVQLNGDLITLTTAPTDCPIWYTVGDDWETCPAVPGPNATGAVLYTEPVALDRDAGLWLLARAYPVPGQARVPGNIVGYRYAPDTVFTAEGDTIVDGEGGVIRL
jgi:hypothetical protein